MPRYRVTYIDATLRERFVEAASAEDAADVVYAELDDVPHHHAADHWIDDLSGSEVPASEREKTGCYECGR